MGRTDKSSPNSLLAKVQQQGWTERLAAQFQDEFGERLRWLVVVQMERVGLLQWRIDPDRVSTLPSQRLELYENTLSDLWVRLLEGLIGQYLNRVRDGHVHQDFIPYTSGVVRHLVIENARLLGLLGRETPGEIIRSICEARLDKTRIARMAWAKFCLEHKVRSELLAAYPRSLFRRAHRSIHRVADYFFEVFIPGNCEGLASRGRRMLDSLVEDFVDSAEQCERACEYIGSVTPFANRGVVREESTDPDDSEYLAVLQQQSERGWLH
jgi:hypothetical protein